MIKHWSGTVHFDGVEAKLDITIDEKTPNEAGASSWYGNGVVVFGNKGIIQNIFLSGKIVETKIGNFFITSPSNAGFSLKGSGPISPLYKL